MNRNPEQLPPWKRYKGAEATWGGWRQGTSEAWWLSVWLPFWSSLSPEERVRYLKQWPPPDEEWDRLLRNLNPHRGGNQP
jgi:hypothetical protein